MRDFATEFRCIELNSESSTSVSSVMIPIEACEDVSDAPTAYFGEQELSNVDRLSIGVPQGAQDSSAVFVDHKREVLKEWGKPAPCVFIREKGAGKTPILLRVVDKADRTLPLSFDNFASRVWRATSGARVLHYRDSSSLPDRAENSIDELPIEAINRLFDHASPEAWDADAQSSFASGVEFMVMSYGASAAEAIAARLLRRGDSEDIIAAALTALGRADDSRSHGTRRQVLENFLSDQSLVVKDGAVQGLEWIDDPQSIPVIEAAIANERSAWFKGILEAFLERLRRVQRWRTY